MNSSWLSTKALLCQPDTEILDTLGAKLYRLRMHICDARKLSHKQKSGFEASKPAPIPSSSTTLSTPEIVFEEDVVEKAQRKPRLIDYGGYGKTRIEKR